MQPSTPRTTILLASLAVFAATPASASEFTFSSNSAIEFGYSIRVGGSGSTYSGEINAAATDGGDVVISLLHKDALLPNDTIELLGISAEQKNTQERKTRTIAKFGSGTIGNASLASVGDRVVASWLQSIGSSPQSEILIKRLDPKQYAESGEYTAQPEPIKIIAGEYLSVPRISEFGPEKEGRVIVVWSQSSLTEDVVNSQRHVYAQRVHTEGRLYDKSYQVSITPAMLGEAEPDVQILNNRKVAIVWVGFDGIYGRIIGAPGDEGPEFKVSSFSHPHAGTPSIVSLGNNGFLVLWTEKYCADCNNDYRLYGRRFDLNGQPMGKPFEINESHLSPKVKDSVKFNSANASASLSTHDRNYRDRPRGFSVDNSGFVVAWTISENNKGQMTDYVVMRSFHFNGIPTGPSQVSSPSTNVGESGPLFVKLSNNQAALVSRRGETTPIDPSYMNFRILLAPPYGDLCTIARPTLALWSPFHDPDPLKIEPTGRHRIIKYSDSHYNIAEHISKDVQAPQTSFIDLTGAQLAFERINSNSLYPVHGAYFSVNNFSVSTRAKFEGGWSGSILDTTKSGNGGRLGVSISKGADGNIEAVISNAIRDTSGSLDPVSPIRLRTTSPIPDGAWHHIAVVANRPNFEINLYVNGVLAANQNIYPNRAISAPEDYNLQLRLGDKNTWSDQKTIAVDDVRVYRHPLRDWELADLAAGEDCIQ